MNNALDDQVNCMKLNNVCVSYIEQGEYLQAILMLTKIVGTIKRSLRYAPGAISSTTTSDKVPGFLPSSREQQECTSKHDNIGYVFCRPIAFPEETIKNAAIGSSDGNSSTLMLKVNSIVVMYNLALAFQLRANSKDELEKAIKLYHLVHRMLVTRHVCQDIQYEPCLIMALANNLGVLYRQVGDTTRSQSFFQHLLSTQMYVLSNSSYCCPVATTNSNFEDTTTVTTATTTNSLDEFWNNTLQLVLKDHTAPVA